MVFKIYKKNLQSQNILVVFIKYLQDAHPHFLRIFSEKTFMEFLILDISEMSNSEYMGKVYIEKSVVPFFKYFHKNLFKEFRLLIFK